MKGRKPSAIKTAPGAALTSVPRPPAWLSADAKAEWRRSLPGLVERRVIADSDLALFENFCVAVGRVREIERELQKPSGFSLPMLRAQDKAIASARQLAAELGLTPVSRSRPAIVDDDDSDDASDLAL